MPQSGNPISPPDASHLTGGSDQQPTGSIPHMRALQVSFSNSNFYELESGDLLIKDVPLLAEGEWTDSAQQTPLLYPAKTLEDCATNWIKRTGWNRHQGRPEKNWAPYGVPRDESNRVSEAINPHYGQFTDKDGISRNAILSDLLVYGSSPNGRAMQELIKRKSIKYVSVEHGGDEVENPQTRRMEAASLVFGGFAFVNKGACKVCRLNEAPAEETTPAPAAAPVEQETMADTKELEDKIAAQDLKIKELSAAIEKATKPAAPVVETPNKELSEAVGKIKELADSNAALLKRIDALEKDGTPATGAGATKELEALPEFFVPVDVKKGIVGEL
jgi:hypothetical protein